MKKKIALVLTMITVMGFAACGDKNGAKETTSIPEITETIMKDIAKKQTEEIITLLEDEAFFSLFGITSEMGNLVSEYRGAVIDQSKDIYAFEFTDNSCKNFIKAQADYGVDVNSLSEVAQKNMISRTLGSVPTTLNGRQGAMPLAAMSVFNVGKAYAMSGNIENQMWVIPTTKDGLAVAVTFTKYDNVLTASCSFILYSPESGEAYQAVDDLLGEFGVTNKVIKFAD